MTCSSYSLTSIEATFIVLHCEQYIYFQRSRFRDSSISDINDKTIYDCIPYLQTYLVPIPFVLMVFEVTSPNYVRSLGHVCIDGIVHFRVAGVNSSRESRNVSRISQWSLRNE